MSYGEDRRVTDLGDGMIGSNLANSSLDDLSLPCEPCKVVRPVQQSTHDSWCPYDVLIVAETSMSIIHEVTLQLKITSLQPDAYNIGINIQKKAQMHIFA